MQISPKPLYKLTDSLLFLFVTMVFLGIFILTFKGFDGSDDMHYAMLASMVLHHRFEPFFSGDIFSGRLGLIYWQAFLYAVGGINPVVTQSGTLFCTVLCCYLTIFKLMPERTPVKVVLAGAIFYFTPVLHASVNGIYPDAYVMLGVILVIILLRKTDLIARSRPFITGMLAGLVIFLTCLFKEEGIILFAALGVLTLISRSKRQVLFFAGAVAASALLFSCYGFFLWKESGDFFLRLSQIRNDQFVEDLHPGKCHSLLSFGGLMVRITYGPWTEMIRQGYFPVLISFIILLGERISRLQDFALRREKTIFLVLLFTLLYFPSRADHYQPVCTDMRHYLLLLPFATILMTEKITGALQDRRRRLLLLVAAGLCLAGIVALSLNKWKWLTYGGLALLSALTGAAGKKYPAFFAGLFLLIMAFLGLERLFFLKSNWYYDLKAVHRLYGGEFAYLPDHDNFMQWRLFNHFTDTAVLNIETFQVPPDRRYGPFYTGFRPGRLIVNRLYSSRSPMFFNTIDSFYRRGTLAGKDVHGEVTAYRVDRATALDSLRVLIRQEIIR